MLLLQTNHTPNASGNNQTGVIYDTPNRKMDGADKRTALAVNAAENYA
jgi:hypothetical protein